ncbi:inhibitor of nuclear factor kappa-B kinase subunit alpha isoform X2 [Latimeria chalumnae]|uniref:inhibitor of nuclear factor kappa-B kinase subunit alpha isoform X2 n=1 Tax=Latimeria chalumnae TaxID=7897 RepID=UPI00313D21C2
MEKPPFRQLQVCGSWEMKERLGTGGFGNVYMYQNKDTTVEKIAIKSCRLELSAKNKERWCHEIQIMKKLRHPNVVTALEVPEGMNPISINDLPLLAMEYCCGGDLRKLLNKPENCCGLKESEVLCLLNEIGAGIQYLHGNRIIHRDLKPENVVLQEVNAKLVHKIIDLGYAKDLDQGSLCTSFVGTLQYLAPELFERNTAYTVSVDYWSFGTMVFECITGFRPFLHNLQPFQWQDKIRKKEPKFIMATEDMSGEIRFSTQIPQPHNLSSIVVEPLEKWLQLMLSWDSKQRGGGEDPMTKQPLCFMLMNQILGQKIVNILNMTSAKILSLPVGPDESLNSLQQRIERETGIATCNQELLLETGMSPDPRKPACQCVLDEVRGWDKYIVYLFDKSRTIYDGPFASRSLPEHVNFIVQDSTLQLPNSRLRKVWAEAVHYISGLKEDYSRLFQGQRAAMLSLLRYNTNLTKMRTTMFSSSQQLRAKLEFFKHSIQLDLERYVDQMAYGISSEKMLKAWREMEERATTCGKAAEVTHLDEQIVALHAEIVEVQRSPCARRQGEVMENLELKAIDLYKQLKAKSKEQHFYSNSTEMVKIIVQTVQSQDRVLKELFGHLSKLLASKQKIIELLPKIEIALGNIKEAESNIMQMQFKRQREIWHLLKIACTQSPTRSLLVSSLEASSTPQTPGSWLNHGQPFTSQGNIPHPLSSMAVPKEGRALLHEIEENQSCISLITSLLQEVQQEQCSSMMSDDWSWLQV